MSQSVGSLCNQAGKQTLLAHITRKSAIMLDLQIGMAVYVQIKGTSLLN